MDEHADRQHLVRETLLFDWKQWDQGIGWRAVPAMAIALGLGIGTGHPAGGLIAAAGAFTAGFGSRQEIRGSRVLPMLLAAAGTALSTFVGMVLGHESVLLVVMAGIWAATYALLTVLQGGRSWVGQQCTVYLLVASAFHATPEGSLHRCSLVFAGGLLQTLITGAILRRERHGAVEDSGGQSQAQTQSQTQSQSQAQSQSQTQTQTQSRAQPQPGLWRSVGGVWNCLKMQHSACVYSLRMAVVVTAATEIYRHTNFLSGYWIPMTTLLVVRADFYQTLTRGVMRVTGTVIGAGIAGLIAAHLHPAPAVLAVFILFFAWWAYSVLNVNYALFTLNLTAYIVFLLSLSGLPAAEVVERRALYTLLGGAIALFAYLDVFRKTRLWIRAERLASAYRQAV